MKIVFISGANRGIGLATVKELLQYNNHIIAAIRNPTKSDTLKKLKLQNPEKLTIMELDVASESSRKNLFLGLKNKSLKINVLINNAGVYSGGKYPISNINELLQINFYGVLHLTHKLFPLLAKDAKIINISSGSGSLSQFSDNTIRQLLRKDITETELDSLLQKFIESNGIIPEYPKDSYSVSKAFLNILTRIWHNQWGREKTIISICPGWVRTDMGGLFASRSVKKGAETIVWATETASIKSGLFYRDKKTISW